MSAASRRHVADHYQSVVGFPVSFVQGFEICHQRTWGLEILWCLFGVKGFGEDFLGDVE